MRLLIPVLLAGALAGALLLISCGSGGFGPGGPVVTPLPPGADAVRGGGLYDKWWVMNGTPAPVGTNPAYPPAGQRTGETTWRCKECHGWDTIGAAGAYATGSHYTGIKGVLDTAGWDPGALFGRLKAAPDHDFSSGMSDADLWDLVAFLKQGMIDMRAYIDLGTGQASGNVTAGGVLYDGPGRCAGCHGPGGRAIDFGGGTGVPDVARGNPWETLHKIRWGHPGSGMPSAVANGLGTNDHVNILTYCQALP